MQINILKKCVEELKKPEPKIDYVLGMLESVIELSAGNLGITLTPGYGSITIPAVTDNLPTITSSSVLMDLNSTTDSYVTTPGPIGKLS